MIISWEEVCPCLDSLNIVETSIPVVSLFELKLRPSLETKLQRGEASLGWGILFVLAKDLS